MKIYEFINNNVLLDLIKDMIYFDDKWMFPQYNLKEFLESSGYKITDEFFIISNKIIDELNNNNVDVYDFDESFNKIIKLHFSKY